MKKVLAVFGISTGYAQNKNTTVVSNSSTLSLAGSGFLLEGFYDYPLLENFEVSVRLGVNPFVASGTTANSTICNSGQCDINLIYINTDGIVKYVFPSEQFKTWVGIGVGLLYPIKKSSSLIDSSDINLTQKIMLVVGSTYQWSENIFIPIEFNYAIFSTTSLIQMTQVNFKLGVGFSL